MQRSNVPKFGNWENEDNVPYTVYFEKARKNKGGGGGKMTNPNDPNESPEVFPDAASQIAPPTNLGTKADELVARGAVKPVHEQRESRGDGDYRQPNKSPARGENVGGQRNVNEAGFGGRGQRQGGRPARISGGSEQSMDHRSPLHPHHQAKLTGAGSASPGWDGKTYDNSRAGDHGRTRQRQTPRGDESVSFLAPSLLFSV